MAHQGAGSPQPRRRTRPAPPSVARPPRRRGRSSRPAPVAGAPHRPGPQPHPVSSTGHAASRVRGPPAEACSTSALALWLQRSLQRFDIHHLLLLPCSLSQPRCRHSFDVSQRPARVLVDQPHQNVDARGAVEPERVDDGSVSLLVSSGNRRPRGGRRGAGVGSDPGQADAGAARGGFPPDPASGGPCRDRSAARRRRAARAENVTVLFHKRHTNVVNLPRG
jgi:hypothetical protein